MTTKSKSSGVRFEHVLRGAGGLLVGAWLVKDQAEQFKKSRAEIDDPDGVATICEEVGPILDDWEPDHLGCEDEYVDDLYEYLCDVCIEGGGSAVEEIELRSGTPEGVPDILIDDRLAIEVKCGLTKSERDRVVGQCAGYSREWVTWVVLIDTPMRRVRELEELLENKGLAHILVFSF
ncbi:MAG: hypothetical protein ACRD3Q_21215 [Terriglobales bacterium]